MDTPELLAIHGPVHLRVSRRGDGVAYRGDDDGARLDAAWWAAVEEGLAALADALPALASRLHDALRADGATRIALRLRLGDGWIGAGVFEDDARIPARLRPALRRWVDAAIALAGPLRRMPWETAESHLAQSEAAWLARTDPADVPRLVRFMERCDLDHEVDHGEDMRRAVLAHGWCPETLALWVARATTCCGQWGLEVDWDDVPGLPLAGWIEADPARAALAVALLAGALRAARLEGDPTWFDDVARQLGGRGEALVAEAFGAAGAGGSPRGAGSHWLDALR
jgi:hypothetical protein